MSSNEQTLIRMANQIAAAFKAYPTEQAISEIRGHIKSFWTPKMRFAINHRAAADPTGIDPLVIEAVSVFEQPAAPSS